MNAIEEVRAYLYRVAVEEWDEEYEGSDESYETPGDSDEEWERL